MDIGGRKLNFAEYGAGKPVVVVQAGLGEPSLESHSWDKVVAGICRTHEICQYDRAGLGLSDGVTNASRTSQDLADDLHALLSIAKVPPPFILVGHSVGGFTVRLYASKYPGDVAGVVLVDSTYPDQWSKWLAIFPAPSPGEPESVKNARTLLGSQVGSPAGNPDRLDLTASGRQVLAASDFRNKPLVVLTHSPTWRTDSKLPPDLSDRMEGLWLQSFDHQVIMVGHQTIRVDLPTGLLTRFGQGLIKSGGPRHRGRFSHPCRHD